MVVMLQLLLLLLATLLLIRSSDLQIVSRRGPAATRPVITGSRSVIFRDITGRVVLHRSGGQTVAAGAASTERVTPIHHT
jgi:hypothetical protein